MLSEKGWRGGGPQGKLLVLFLLPYTLATLSREKKEQKHQLVYFLAQK